MRPKFQELLRSRLDSLKNKGVSQAKIASLCKVSSALLTATKKGNKTFPLDFRLNLLADALGLKGSEMEQFKEAAQEARANKNPGAVPFKNLQETRIRTLERQLKSLKAQNASLGRELCDIRPILIDLVYECDQASFHIPDPLRDRIRALGNKR